MLGVLQWRRGWDLFLVEIPRRILPGGVFDGSISALNDDLDTVLAT